MLNIENKGREFEEYVHYIYDFLLNIDTDQTEEIIVTKNAKIRKSNYTHEFDIYYEFKKAGITHRVAIECKNTNVPINKGRVQEFESKLRDLNNIIGAIISLSGFQDGAKMFADEKGIITLLASDLPNFMQLISIRLTNVFLPNPKQRGEPFYILMEIDQYNNLTGSYEIIERNHKNFIFLFLSKKHAEKYLSHKKIEDLQPRALKQESYDHVILMATRLKAMFSIIILPGDTETNFIGFDISPEDLKKEYYYI
ncbi:restriction endonuclease [Mucilaginibacter jinjuensis]|uniref:Restriction endonuclease n=1 Tax=Mucilaginibacter jinjuensis TaxID=1176721 RepID=A0ABY7T659_9SPHI|nr:restriction endonuclease [Mucilaginibacter jinjuensis]WCT11748.1 restriction endonuclease [Mucilaginibacter jinjuensis]